MKRRSKEACPECFHDGSWHKEAGCTHPYCGCKAGIEAINSLLENRREQKKSFY